MVSGVSADEIDDDMRDAQDHQGPGMAQSDREFVALMGRAEFRRHWMESVAGPLFRRHLASTQGLRMAIDVSKRDEACEQFDRARRLCPELVYRAMSEADERASSSGSSAGRPTK